MPAGGMPPVPGGPAGSGGMVDVVTELEPVEGAGLVLAGTVVGVVEDGTVVVGVVEDGTVVVGVVDAVVHVGVVIVLA